MGKYLSASERAAKNKAASQQAIDDRFYNRGSTRVGQPYVTSQDILTASEVDRIRRKNRGQG